MNKVILNINLINFNQKVTSQNGLFLKNAFFSIKKIFFGKFFWDKIFLFKKATLKKKFFFLNTNLLSYKFFKRNIEKTTFLIFFVKI